MLIEDFSSTMLVVYFLAVALIVVPCAVSAVTAYVSQPSSWRAGKVYLWSTKTGLIGACLMLASIVMEVAR